METDAAVAILRDLAARMDMTSGPDRERGSVVTALVTVCDAVEAMREQLAGTQDVIECAACFVRDPCPSNLNDLAVRVERFRAAPSAPPDAAPDAVTGGWRHDDVTPERAVAHRAAELRVIAAVRQHRSALDFVRNPVGLDTWRMVSDALDALDALCAPIGTTGEEDK